MALITLPTIFEPASCTLSLSVNQRVNAAPFGGSEQAIDLLNDRWLLTCELPNNSYATTAQIDAFVGAMRGQVNTVALWHFARPTPRGTIAGAKTLSASAAQGASSIGITATGTVLAGDMLGVGGLLLMAAADATSSAGVITVTLANRLRTALSSGAAVTTTKPTANFRLLGTSGTKYLRGYATTASFDFGEAI
jgi:hypothetical protein